MNKYSLIMLIIFICWIVLVISGFIVVVNMIWGSKMNREEIKAGIAKNVETSRDTTKVYCSLCKYYSRVFGNGCLAEKIGIHNSWYDKVVIYANPEEKNKDNSCKDYKEKWGSKKWSIVK